MIRTYKYINTIHSKLHEFVLAFFKKIETDTGGFRDELFEPEFLPIVDRHSKILKERFNIIYDYVNSLSLDDRKSFCDRIIKSNQIEKICSGEYKPEAFASSTKGVYKTMKGLFLDLYNQVLDGEPFREYTGTTLREHFNQFCDANKDITLCPICGIGELKKAQDKSRDQYDHYLPKAIYPFSSINFRNLVPCCKECNSFDAKGEKDIIAESTGKLLFPYDEKHKGISIVVRVKNDNAELHKIEWELAFNNPENKVDEIDSWRTIYSIDSRYQGYIKARIEKWYKHYYNYSRNPKLSKFDSAIINICYIEHLEEDVNLGLNFIRKPTLEGLIWGSNIVQAQTEALRYV